MIIKFYYANPKKKTKKFLSKFMQIGENVSFSHCAIGLQTFGQEKIYEFVFPKSRKILINDWLKEYEVVREIQWAVPEVVQYPLYNYLERQVNKWYSMTQILVIGLTCVFKPLDFFFKKIKINGAKAQICTELLSRVAEKFMGYKMNKSHDEFGLEDSYHMGNLLELNVKWVNTDK